MRQNRAGVAALVGVAALLLTPATSSAQVNIRIGNPFYGYYPGYYSYGYFPYGWGYASPYYYGGYGYSPGYYGSGYYGTYPGGANSYPSYYSSPNYYFTPSTTYSYGAPADTSGYYASRESSPPAGSNTVLLNVRLPDADAEVWVQGQRTQQRGTWREYISPSLNPNQNYTYDVRARWTENGQDVERTRSVRVRPNDVATVDFTTANTPRPRVDEIDRGSGTTRPKDTKPPR
jgi:uncharacterized protein (TIGR03000 family)